jgi:uncharacterized protein involved in exopolysaccharide biosynthesis
MAANWMRKSFNSAGSTWLSLSKPGPWIILVPALFGSLLGFLLSFGFPQKYTSQSLILVESSDPQQNGEHSLPSRDSGQPITEMQNVLNGEKLKARIDGMVPGKDLDQEVADIRQHTRLTPVSVNVNDNSVRGKDNASAPQSANAFHVEYTASSPSEAQLMCNAVTSILLQENVTTPQQEVVASSDNLQSIKAAKRDVDEQNARLAQFKKRHVGQLPADVEKNMSTSEDLHAQLNMLSERLQSAQLNKADAEAQLRRASSVRSTTEKRDRPQKVESTAALEKQLSDLRSQLLQLQAEYTDDHPDVLKTKNEIASIEKRLADANHGNETSQSDANPPQQETAETRQLRSRIQQDDQVIDQTTSEQKRIQNQISALQTKLAVEPSVESDYEQLVRSRDAAKKKYAIVKANMSGDHPSTAISPQSSGRIRMLSPATVSRTPSFPNRLLFAISGWLGLAVVMRFALWITQPDSLPAVNAVSQEAKVFSSNT